MKTTHSKFKTLAALTLASAMGLATTEAGAVILLIKTNKNLQASPDYASTALVDFNGPAAGGTVYNFTTSAANQNVLISFHAECQGQDPSDGYADYEFGFVLAQIEVDPQGPAGWQTVSPTGDSPEFSYFPQLCSGPGYNYSGLDAHIATLPAGTHKIRVRIGSHLDGASIRAKSLVVQR
ncbi:MAG: hypothetical protein ACREYF_26740 [Gammaproteobacteria bacterium]